MLCNNAIFSVINAISGLINAIFSSIVALFVSCTLGMHFGDVPSVLKSVRLSQGVSPVFMLLMTQGHSSLQKERPHSYSIFYERGVFVMIDMPNILWLYKTKSCASLMKRSSYAYIFIIKTKCTVNMPQYLVNNTFHNSTRRNIQL